MSAPIELDLDVLEAMARTASDWTWPTADQFADSINSAQMADLIAATKPAVVLELVRRLRAAEALSASRIEQIPTEAKMVIVFTDLIQEHPELRDQFEEFAEAIKKRCTSGRWTLVAFFPAGSDIQAMDAEQMRAAGWVRADQTT